MVLRLPLKNLIESYRGFNKRRRRRRKKLVMGTKNKKMMKTESEEKETDNSKKNSEILASCSFSSLGLNPIICDQVRAKMGFKAPTTVQAQAIPVILSG